MNNGFATIRLFCGCMDRSDTDEILKPWAYEECHVLTDRRVIWRKFQHERVCHWQGIRAANGGRDTCVVAGHDDKELPCVMNNEIFHYHYDWRFIMGEPKMNSAVKGSEPEMFLHRCWREQHPWNPGLIFASYELMRRYKDSTAKNGRCPHRGAEIDPVTGQCPAHGLCFNKDGKMKFDFDKLEYRIGVDRIKCHGQSFEVQITKKGEVQDIDMVCGDEVVSRWTLPNAIPFDELDTFKFFEKCGSHEVEIQTTQLSQEERSLIKMFGKNWRDHVTQ